MKDKHNTPLIGGLKPFMEHNVCVSVIVGEKVSNLWNDTLRFNVHMCVWLKESKPIQDATAATSSSCCWSATEIPPASIRPYPSPSLILAAPARKTKLGVVWMKVGGAEWPRKGRQIQQQIVVQGRVRKEEREEGMNERLSRLEHV